MELIHDFYIIESLKPDDIKDGKVFYDSLNSIKKIPIYEFVSDFKEFEKALLNFEKSQYKYLLISAHGDEENLILKNENVNLYDFEDIKIRYDQRRIFMSSCRGGSYLFAKYFISKGAYSVIGTSDDLNQIVAVGMWPTMLIIFERMSTDLNYVEINSALDKLINIYQINLHYFSFIRNKKKMKEYIFQPNKKRERKDYPL